MDDRFICGVILGMLGGAVLVTNSVKARKMVKEGQEQVVQKVNEMSSKQKNKQED